MQLPFKANAHAIVQPCMHSTCVWLCAVHLGNEIKTTDVKSERPVIHVAVSTLRQLSANASWDRNLHERALLHLY